MARAARNRFNGEFPLGDGFGRSSYSPYPRSLSRQGVPDIARFQLKIIGGKYRRRGLFSNPGMTTRPIANRMKEFLFEELRYNIPDARVLDAFAGTGTIGLEALSRGAKSVVFIEQDHKAFELLNQNIGRLEVESETFAWRSNILRSSFLPKGFDDFVPYDLMFFDPPYPMVPGMSAKDPLYKTLERVARDTVSSHEAVLLFRTERKTDFEIPPEWTVVDELTVSSSTMYFYRKTDSLESEPATTETAAEEADTEE